MSPKSEDRWGRAIFSLFRLAFLLLDGFPLMRAAVAGAFAEDMRVAADHLCRDGFRHIGKANAPSSSAMRA